MPAPFMEIEMRDEEGTYGPSMVHLVSATTRGTTFTATCMRLFQGNPPTIGTLRESFSDYHLEPIQDLPNHGKFFYATADDPRQRLMVVRLPDKHCAIFAQSLVGTPDPTETTRVFQSFRPVP